jgi:hypothetical protein
MHSFLIESHLRIVRNKSGRFDNNLRLLKKNKIMQLVITNSGNPCGDLRTLHGIVRKYTDLQKHGHRTRS